MYPKTDRELFIEKAEELAGIIPDSKDKCVFAMLAGNGEQETGAEERKIKARVLFKGNSETFIIALFEAMEENTELAQWIVFVTDLIKYQNPALREPNFDLHYDLYMRMLSKKFNLWTKKK